MKQLLSLAALTIASSLFVLSCTTTNVVLTRESTAVCSADQLTEWTRVTEQTLGVRGEDPVGFHIANYPAEMEVNRNNWYPLSGYKETLCGVLNNSIITDAGDEMDWNNYVNPTDDFQYLIEGAVPYKGGSGIWCKDDPWVMCREEVCIEAELTPDDAFFENPWFPKSAPGTSVLKCPKESPVFECQPICFYGPWVRECNHGNRPEIHPSELIWWKQKWGSGDLYWLMALQDDSDRYAEFDQFDIEGTAPAEWRPWAAPPMTARFDFPFKVAPAGGAVRYEIGEAFARHVVTGSDAKASADDDDGVAHAIQYNGRIVVTATEGQPKDADVGVRFTDLCRRTNGTLQGYVTLTTKTGIDADGKEGYHVLFVLARKEGDLIPPVHVPAGFDLRAVSANGDPSSIRPGEVAGRRQLLADVDVQLASNSRIDRVEIVTAASRRELQFVPATEKRAARIKDLPLLGAGQLILHTRSGDSIPVPWPGISVDASIDDHVMESSELPSSGWAVMVKAAGGRIDNAPGSPLRVKRATRIRVKAFPQYAMLKEGAVSLEEDSSYVERLNEVLERGNAEETMRLFGSAQPVQVAWSITAINLTTGAAVPIDRRTSPGPASSGETIVVTDIPGKGYAESLEIAFPSRSDAVYEVRTVAEVTDVFGSTRKIEDRVWSHSLADGSRAAVSSLLPAIAAAAGVSAEGLIAAERLGILSRDDPRRRDPQTRRALVVRNFATQATDDGEISLDEVMALIRGARLLRQ